MNIRSYNLERLSRFEIFQLLDNMLTITDVLEEEMPQSYTDKREELQAAFEIFDIEVAQERRPSPAELLKAQEGREYAIRKTYQLIRDYSNYRFDTNRERAAKSLLRIFKIFGTGSKISRFNQDKQTGVIVNLLQELALDEAMQHIETLHLTDAIVALTAYNNTFEKEQLSRRKQHAEFVVGVAKNARADAQARFLEFVDLINALSVVEGPDKYADLKQKISSIVREYVTQARQRDKKRVIL